MIRFENRFLKKIDICSPIKGKLIDITKSSDNVFSSKAMGDGIIIKPTLDKQTIVSPMDGKIVALADTKHAIGIRSRNGFEILIHIGIDTVKLNGEPFNFLSGVKIGANVKCGQQLIDTDFQRIKECHLSSDVLVINTSKNKIDKRVEKSVDIGDTIYVLS